MPQFSRQILSPEDTKTVAVSLQERLFDLIDLALQLKQAHWCVIGRHFRSVHLQLDEILIDVRNGSDEVAERMSTLGVAPDGMARSTASGSTLKPMDVKFAVDTEMESTVSDLLQKTIEGLRASIEVVGEIDPITEDLLIGMSAGLEKHLWMMQAQEQ